MAFPIADALKRFVLSAAIRFGPLGHSQLTEPEPIRRRSDGSIDAWREDDWLFDGDVSSVAPAVNALSRELTRLSGTIGGLRTLLSDLAAVAPLETAPVNAVVSPNYRWEEDVLFDGCGDVPVAQGMLQGEPTFLFDDEFAPSSWTVLRPEENGLAHPM